MERDIKISECYLRLGEIGLENENYTGAIGDLLECQILQKQHFGKLDRRIAESHYHLGSAYSFEKRYNNAKEHFESARKIIIDNIDNDTEEFDPESEKESDDEEIRNLRQFDSYIKAYFLKQLKDILPDLNSKLEDIECSIKNEKFNKVQEHLDEKVKFFNVGIMGEFNRLCSKTIVLKFEKNNREFFLSNLRMFFEPYRSNSLMILLSFESS